MINEYFWKLYLQAGGKEIVDFFKDNLTTQLPKTYADQVKQLHEVYADKWVTCDTYAYCKEKYAGYYQWG